MHGAGWPMTISTTFQRLPGLPTYGPMAMTIPSGWGHGAREGLVVEFRLADGSAWVGNFEPGIGGIDDVVAHPNGTDVLVIASGQVWWVNPITRGAVRGAPWVNGLWTLAYPYRLLFNNQDLEFLCLDATGVAWATKRISWDGFRHLRLDDEVLEGEAWSPPDHWSPFRVNLGDGTVVGGSYTGPDMRITHDDWELGPA